VEGGKERPSDEAKNCYSRLHIEREWVEQTVPIPIKKKKSAGKAGPSPKIDQVTTAKLPQASERPKAQLPREPKEKNRGGREKKGRSSRQK